MEIVQIHRIALKCSSAHHWVTCSLVPLLHSCWFLLFLWLLLLLRLLLLLWLIWFLWFLWCFRFARFLRFPWISGSLVPMVLWVMQVPNSSHSRDEDTFRTTFSDLCRGASGFEHDRDFCTFGHQIAILVEHASSRIDPGWPRGHHWVPTSFDGANRFLFQNFIQVTTSGKSSGVSYNAALTLVTHCSIKKFSYVFYVLCNLWISYHFVSIASETIDKSAHFGIKLLSLWSNGVPESIQEDPGGILECKSQIICWVCVVWIVYYKSCCMHGTDINKNCRIA